MTISDKYDVQTGYLKKKAFEEFADMAERDEKFKSVPVGVLFTDIRFALKTAYENMRADKERYHAEHH